uniref:CD209c molecule n=1 Tax=Rattus norvegicus TaxID=10116 RepID=A0ABK0LUU9_RAT
MGDSEEDRVQQLSSLDEEHLIASSTRYSLQGFRFQPPYILKKAAGYLCHGLVPFVLQLICLTLCAILLLAILIKDHLCRPCPWDWTFFQGNCYFFSKFQQNWKDSVTSCRKLGAQLVVVKSDDEQSFLQQTSKEKGYAWMVLSDLKREGIWHWVDGSHLLFSFTKYWNKGEPNNEWEEDCAEFRGDGWNDAPCTNKKYWICKKSALSCTGK